MKYNTRSTTKPLLIFVFLTSLLGGCVSLEGIDTFTDNGVLTGSTFTEELCHFPDYPNTSVWVVVDGKGECIRYFHSGLKDSNQIVLVHFHGDRMWCGTRNTGCKKVVGYRNTSPNSLERLAMMYAKNAGFPFIRISRPGVYGSSGIHGSRRLKREIEILNAAMEAIKERHNIESFSLSGQSGGGHVTTSLITKRSDVTCAVSSSGAVAVGMRIRAKGWSRDVTGFSYYFDPIKHIEEIPKNTGLRIFLLGDPRDATVPFSTQKAYHEKANNAGYDVTLIELFGSGSNNHGLAKSGVIVSAWCARGDSTTEILDRTKNGFTSW